MIEEALFDADYWRNVDLFGKTCNNCGHVIRPHDGSSTGWTHDDAWQGVRCPGLVCGATPARVPS